MSRAREVDFGGARRGWEEPARWRPGAVDIVFVAALEREVSRAARGWTPTLLRVGREERRMYYDTLCPSTPTAGALGTPVSRAAMVCAGTGPERAYRAARACIEQFSPRLLVSIGFAGSCGPELGPGAVIVPARLVVPAAAGDESAAAKEFACACGSGTLLSVNAVTSSAGKRQARARYGALGVEMEAAGVAAAAVEFGREFAAIKAISDGVEEDLDFLSAFVTPDGFAMARFLAYLAVRPRLWPRVAELDRNSRLAVSALEQAVMECIGDWQGFAARHS
jgi:adenosylhomocysteine nucleosidase